MSETIKLIIEMPKWEYEQACKFKDRDFYAIKAKAIQNGIPFETVKTEIKTFTITEKSEHDTGFNDGVLKCFNALDNIDKEE